VSRSFAQCFFMQPSGNANDGVTPNPGVFYDGTLALAANMTTVPVWVKDLDAFGIAFSTPAGSTLVGSIALQVSNDKSQREQNGVPDALLQNWVTLSFWDVAAGAQATTKAVASGAQALMLSERVCAYRWVRLVFTFTSGTGLAKIALQQKGWL
jgi:hypothetical protein